MTQTRGSFADKWALAGRSLFDQTLDPANEINQWIVRRNGFSSLEAFSSHVRPRRRILDAGCGNGRVTALLRRIAHEDAEIVGIDFASAAIAAENLKHLDKVGCHEGDLTKPLERFGRFDFIYCQEVLHHTNDPQLSFSNLCRILEDGGEIAVYVYKKKAVIREFADDYLREHVSKLDRDSALEVSSQLTELGRVLSSLEEEVDIPAIPLLGMQGGRQTVQRFIYDHMLKCFYNASFSETENNLTNFDWYHPEVASRHTLEEVRRWFDDSAISITHECVDAYGITIRGVKSAT